ncbi:conserved hypothetical protein [Vibrio chagasii]|nr:conserved hypothetical protein [Vibrio chagasii]CAH7484733.1 conserved hypothetical protein [Vibrio chagasii]
MSILYLHIGCHKTGTSSIQQTLFNIRTELLRDGISVFCSDPKGRENKNGVSYNWFNLKRENREELISGYGGKVKDYENLVEQLKKHDSEVLIWSCEAFSFYFTHQDIKELERYLSPYFEEIKIIVYIRRQDRLLVSHYQESSKRVNHDSLYYGSSPTALPKQYDHYDEYLDYNERISKWASIFGEDNIIVRVFENAIKEYGDVTNDFLSIFGVNYDYTLINKNVSSGYNKTKLGHIVNTIPNVRRKIVNNVVANLADDRKLLPSRDEAKKVYSRYYESNKKLNKIYKVSEIESIFDDCFDSYPSESNELWSEKQVNRLISELLKNTGEFVFDSNVENKRLSEKLQEIREHNTELSNKIRKLEKEIKSSQEKEKKLIYKYSLKGRIRRVASVFKKFF